MLLLLYPRQSLSTHQNLFDFVFFLFPPCYFVVSNFVNESLEPLIFFFFSFVKSIESQLSKTTPSEYIERKEVGLFSL